MKQVSVFILAIAFLMGGCSPQSGLEVHDAWIRPAQQGGNGAVYFVIENDSSEAEELIGIDSDVAEAVEMHESKMSGDVMQMQQLESVSLSPNAETIFEPGGLHIMLVGLKRELKVGDEIELTLRFRNSDDIKVMAPVRDGPAHEGDH